ncbi:hypothetical protein ACIGXF_38350 [Streptomyces sp. NPDC053086]|uniref:hypothetical protein n=1 Tax=unclassified Streptomyces TaxID=2593676 RepID=UPI0037D77A89
MVYDWNAATHADEAEGEPERRAFTRPELEAFFDHADEEVLRVRGKGWLPAFRDATMFKVAYGYDGRPDLFPGTPGDHAHEPGLARAMSAPTEKVRPGLACLLPAHRRHGQLNGRGHRTARAAIVPGLRLPGIGGCFPGNVVMP